MAPQTVTQYVIESEVVFVATATEVTRVSQTERVFVAEAVAR